VEGGQRAGSVSGGDKFKGAWGGVFKYTK